MNWENSYILEIITNPLIPSVSNVIAIVITIVDAGSVEHHVFLKIHNV
jgi:hypothetical protein